MQPLTLDDLLPLEEYAARRPDLFAAQSRYLERYRRTRVGPRLTLVFENRQTLWFRVHELLRVARLSDPKRVQQELDWYNALLPRPGALQAALLLDGPDAPAEAVGFWRDLEGDHVRLCVGGATVSARLATCRPEDRWVGNAHWLEFAVPEAVRAALAGKREPARFEAEYRDYRHRGQALNPATRQSLSDDLAAPARGRAA